FYRVDAGLRRELWNSVRKGVAGSEPDDVKRRVHRVSQPKITVAEQLLLELLVYDRELQSLIFATLEPSDYEALATAPVFSALMQLNELGEEPSLERLSE